VVRAHLENLAVIAMRDGSWSALPGTELAAKIRERMREGIDAIAARHPGQAVAAVSHAGSINAFVADLLGIQRDFFFPAGNTSVTVVRYTDYGKILVRLNDTAHLESLRV
jgi:broad specificity phosphatase PhoE